MIAGICIKTPTGVTTVLDVHAGDTFSAVMDKIHAISGIEQDDQVFSVRHIIMDMLCSSSEASENENENDAVVVQHGGGKRGTKRGHVDADAKDERLRECQDKMKAFVARTTGMGAYADCVSEFVDTLVAVGKQAEKNPHKVFSDFVSTMSDCDLDALVKVATMPSHKTENKMMHIGRVLFKHDIKELRELQHQVSGVHEVLPIATECILCSELSDDNGHIQWTKFTDMLTTAIRDRARAGPESASAGVNTEGDDGNNDNDDDDPMDGRGSDGNSNEKNEHKSKGKGKRAKKKDTV